MDRRDKICLLSAFIAAIGLIYVAPLFLATPLLDPDEGIHAVIAQEMAERDDFVVPRFLGQPFLDKPVLYFWAQAFSLKCFGMNEAAIRLPGMIFALLGVWTTFLLARTLFNKQVALFSGLISLTLFVPAILAQAATHDIAQVPWTNLLLLCLWTADEQRGWSRARLLLGAGLFVGLALLTKGLIGIALVSTGYWLFAIFDRRLTRSRIANFLTAVVCGAVLAAPWYWAMEIRCPGYLVYYFVERHVMGFVTSTQLHAGEPWHYYLPIVLLGSFPWLVPAVIGSCRAAGRERLSSPDAPKSVRFVFWWFIGGLLFLSVASSKLITYSLPIFPPIAILAGYACRRYVTGTLSRSAQIWMSRTLAATAMLGIVAPFLVLQLLQRALHIKIAAPAWCAAAVGTLVALTALLGLARGHRFRAVSAVPIWTALMIATVMAWPLQSVSERFTQRTLARHISGIEPFPSRLVVTGDRIASLVFYLSPTQRARIRESLHEIPTWEVHERVSLSDTVLIVAKEVRGRKWINRAVGRRPSAQVGRYHVFSPQRPIRLARPPTLRRAP